MNNTYKTDYKVRYSEVDCNYCMRLDYVFTHFQDITGLHSIEMGIDGKNLLEKSNAFWVLTKIKMKIGHLPSFEESIEIETWPTEARGVRFGRNYNISQNGQILVSGISEWCTLDADSGRPRKADTIAYPHTMEHRKEQSRAGEFLKNKENVDEAMLHHTHCSSLTDIDTNNHTNNIAYLRMILNCFSKSEFEMLNIDEFQVAFLAQTFYGDEIDVYKKQTDYGFYFEGKKEEMTVFTSLMTLK